LCPSSSSSDGRSEKSGPSSQSSSPSCFDPIAPSDSWNSGSPAATRALRYSDTSGRANPRIGPTWDHQVGNGRIRGSSFISLGESLGEQSDSILRVNFPEIII
jgi:hypothetical protein